MRIVDGCWVTVSLRATPLGSEMSCAHCALLDVVMRWPMLPNAGAVAGLAVPDESLTNDVSICFLSCAF